MHFNYKLFLLEKLFSVPRKFIQTKLVDYDDSERLKMQIIYQNFTKKNKDLYHRLLSGFQTKNHTSSDVVQLVVDLVINGCENIPFHVI